MILKNTYIIRSEFANRWNPYWAKMDWFAIFWILIFKIWILFCKSPQKNCKSFYKFGNRFAITWKKLQITQKNCKTVSKFWPAYDKIKKKNENKRRKKVLHTRGNTSEMSYYKYISMKGNGKTNTNNTIML